MNKKKKYFMPNISQNLQLKKLYFPSSKAGRNFQNRMNVQCILRALLSLLDFTNRDRHDIAIKDITICTRPRQSGTSMQFFWHRMQTLMYLYLLDYK